MMDYPDYPPAVVEGDARLRRRIDTSTLPGKQTGYDVMKRQCVAAGVLSLAVAFVLAMTWILSQVTPQAAYATAPHAAVQFDGQIQAGSVLTVCPAVIGTCPFTTIQAAVDAANAGDVIKGASAVYTDVQSRPAPLDYGGPSAITQVVYITKTITIQGGYAITNWTSAYPISQPTTLDARRQGRAFFIAGDIGPTIAGLHVTGGDAAGLGGHPVHYDSAGGGLYVVTATVTVVDSHVFSNSACYGGGLFLSYGDAVLHTSTFATNTAVNGGGLYVYKGDATLAGNTVSANKAATGGGIDLYKSDAMLDGNTIESNTADVLVGGGLYLYESGITLSGNTVASNTSSGSGGGLYASEESTVTSTGDTLTANTAHGSGGGMYLLGNTRATLSKIAVISNTAHGGGGGLFLEDDTRAMLSGITVTANTALWGGGGLYLGEDTRVTLVRGTVASNTTDGPGGGLFVMDNYGATLIDSVVTDNRAGTAGGGLYACFFSVVTLDRNAVLSNTAQRGGGLYLSESTAVLTNNIVADNQAGVAGSGMYVEKSSSGRLLHTTIARNYGGDGSALLVTGGGWPPSIVVLTNTILVSHTVGVTATGDNEVALQATLWGTGTWANESDWGGTGTIITGTNNIRGEPAFVDPDVCDYRIISDSAAIDEGVDAGARRDIEGQPRPLRAPDLGADEYWPPGTPKRIHLPLVLRQF